MAVFITKNLIFTYTVSMKKIVLTGGGTAGHVSPNLTLVPHLKKHFDEIYYIGSNGIEKELVKKAGIPFYEIPSTKLRRKLTLKNLGIPFTLISAINKAKILLKNLKPDIIFSKGGYVSLPVVIAGNALKIPVVSHESDITAGLANKIASKYCVKTLTAFPQTEKEFKNGLFIGSPVKANTNAYDYKKCLNEFSFNSDKPVLLIFGGSLGAKRINETVFNCLDELLKDFFILHITGKNSIKNAPKKAGYKAVEFINDMNSAYACASVCVSRAGANSAFELLSLKIPTVFIPLSKAESRGDQEKNAEYFFKSGLAHIIYEKDLTENSLIFTVKSAYLNAKTVKTEPNIITDASEKIADLLIKTANKNHA